MPQATAQRPFSVENFRVLFEKTTAREYMAAEDVEIVQEAIARNDTALLEKLYPILASGAADEEKIFLDFLETKKKVTDELQIAIIEAKKRLIEKPQKKRREAAEKEERREADRLLKNI